MLQYVTPLAFILPDYPAGTTFGELAPPDATQWSGWCSARLRDTARSLIARMQLTPPRLAFSRRSASGAPGLAECSTSTRPSP
jgi:hypothetical protein